MSEKVISVRKCCYMGDDDNINVLMTSNDADNGFGCFLSWESLTKKNNDHAENHTSACSSDHMHCGFAVRSASFSQ